MTEEQVNLCHTNKRLKRLDPRLLFVSPRSTELLVIQLNDIVNAVTLWAFRKLFSLKV